MTKGITMRVSTKFYKMSERLRQKIIKETGMNKISQTDVTDMIAEKINITFKIDHDDILDSKKRKPKEIKFNLRL